MNKQLTPWNKYINTIKIMVLPGFELPFFFFLSFFSFFSMLPGCTYLMLCSCFWSMTRLKRKVPCAIKQLLFSSKENIISWPTWSTTSNFSEDLVNILNRSIILALEKRPRNLQVGKAVLDFILVLRFFGKLCSIILSSNSWINSELNKRKYCIDEWRNYTQHFKELFFMQDTIDGCKAHERISYLFTYNSNSKLE